MEGESRVCQARLTDVVEKVHGGPKAADVGCHIMDWCGPNDVGLRVCAVVLRPAALGLTHVFIGWARGDVVPCVSLRRRHRRIDVNVLSDPNASTRVSPCGIVEGDSENGVVAVPS